MWSDSVNEKAVKAQENHANSIQNTIDKIKEQQKVADKISSLAIKRAELEGKSINEIARLKLDELERHHFEEEDLIQKSYDKRVVLRGLANKAQTQEDRDKYNDQIKDLKENEKELSLNYRSFNLERQNLEIETNKRYY